MIERKLVRVVRSMEGLLFMKWVIAAVAEICDECSVGIRPGDEMATRREPLGRDALNHQRFAERTYCKPCGEFLEDSLVTTETAR